MERLPTGPRGRIPLIRDMARAMHCRMCVPVGARALESTSLHCCDGDAFYTSGFAFMELAGFFLGADGFGPDLLRGTPSTLDIFWRT